MIWVRGGGDGGDGSLWTILGGGYLIVAHRPTYLPIYRHKMGGGSGEEAKHQPARNEWGGLGYDTGAELTGWEEVEHYTIGKALGVYYNRYLASVWIVPHSRDVTQKLYILGVCASS